MRRDGRDLDRQSQESIRILSFKRVERGESVTKVMEFFGYNRTTYYKWKKAYEREGEAGIKRKTGSGSAPLITSKMSQRIMKWLAGKDPREYGYATALWTRKIIGDLIVRKLKIGMSISSVGNLLKRMDITPQKPLRRAYERNEKAVREWEEITYPKIVKIAKKRGAEIFFLDEAGIASDSNLGMTWGPKGQTPIVKTSGQRQKINAISAVSPSGKFWFVLYTCKFNSELFIEFLKNFLKRRRKPIILILDGHPSHRAKSVAKFVQETNGKLQILFLPPYAPDLNPDEFVWKHLKENGTSKLPLHKNEALSARVQSDLLQISTNKTIILSFFKAPSVAYSAA
jgi:transposase